MSSFGKVYRITTFGESHCNSVGAIIDGFPSNFAIYPEDIQKQLDRRRPGQSKITTPRVEFDKVYIQSGIENNKTLGSPICAIVLNKNTIPSDYKINNKNNKNNKNIYIPRPSHADYTYIQKYGIHASSGGGRSSARETIGRVIGGSIADKFLKDKYGIEIVAWVLQIGPHKFDIDNHNNRGESYDLRNKITLQNINRDNVDKYITRCPNKDVSVKMEELILKLKEEGDSIGGSIMCICRNVPTGLGEPCFDKLEAQLAHAMLSIPASKGFEIGSGFKCIEMLGSEHNDSFLKTSDKKTDKKNDKINNKINNKPKKITKLKTLTNNSGGIQGGISNGEDIIFTVAFKPPATIKKPQRTSDINGNMTILQNKGRHDPCICPRAVPIVESMSAIVILDNILLQLRNITSIKR